MPFHKRIYKSHENLTDFEFPIVYIFFGHVLDFHKFLLIYFLESWRQFNVNLNGFAQGLRDNILYIWGDKQMIN